MEHPYHYECFIGFRIVFADCLTSEQQLVGFERSGKQSSPQVQPKIKNTFSNCPKTKVFHCMRLKCPIS